METISLTTKPKVRKYKNRNVEFVVVCTRKRRDAASTRAVYLREKMNDSDSWLEDQERGRQGADARYSSMVDDHVAL